MTILFIDNDPEDLELYQEAVGYINSSEFFANRDTKIDCRTLTNCKTVIEHITQLSPSPDIIFLDINMPGIGGKECLQMLKANQQTCHIPVVMLSQIVRCPKVRNSKKWEHRIALENLMISGTS